MPTPWAGTWIIILAALGVACDKAPADESRDLRGPPSAAPSAASSPVPVAAAASPSSPRGEAPFIAVKRAPTDGALPAILSLESATAKQKGLKPYAELRADWCGPCVALEKSMTDDRMRDAFRGVYLVRLDADEWDAKLLSQAGLDGSAIPVFFELNEAGKPTGRRIDGGAWGDNVAANMAPPLKAFFHP